MTYNGGEPSLTPGMAARNPDRKTAATLFEAAARTIWPTPCAADGERQSETLMRGEGNPTLLGAARSLWPTPRGSDGEKGGPNQHGSSGDLMLPSAAAQWRTPTVGMMNQDRGTVEYAERILESDHTVSLAAQAKLWLTPDANSGFLSGASASAWPTPTSRDWKDGRASEETLEGNSRPLNEVATSLCFPQALETQKPGEAPPPASSRPQLNPNFVDWLMALLPGWTACAPVETASWYHRQRSHCCRLLRAWGYA